MAAEERVKVGRWTDFSSHRNQITVTDFYATLLKTLLAVFLTLAGTYVVDIAFSTILGGWIWIQDRGTDRARDPERRLLLGPSHRAEGGSRNPPNGSTTTIDNGARPGGQPNGTASPQDEAEEILDETRSVRDFGFKLLLYNCKRENGHKTFMTLLGMGLAALAVSRIIAGLFSAQIAADKTARWDSTTCGTWRLNSNASGERAAALNDILYMREKESRAGEYARNCYGSTNSLQSLPCDFFYRRKIHYESTRPWECPFDDDVCFRGQRSITFDTGLIDANDIGVNSEHPYKFRRRTSCAALSVDDRFVREESKDGKPTYFYEYGTKESMNYTYSSTGDPHTYPVPGYLVRTYFTVHPERDLWKPIPALSPDPGNSTTIMFISALRLFYPEVNDDPVFPADKKLDPEDDEVWYYKSDPRARAIACSDRNEMCSQNGKVCWPLDELPKDMTFPRDFWFLKLAMEKANIWQSIQTRLGDALIAHEKVTGFMSQDLAPEDRSKRHWMEEVERLFQTSLARIQFDAWSIASGEDAARVDQDGYSETTPEEAGNLCDLFIFRSSDHYNILVYWFFGLMSLFPILCILDTKVSSWNDFCGWAGDKLCCCCRRSSGNPGGNSSGSLSTVNRDGTEADAEPSPDQAIATTEVKKAKWEKLFIHSLIQWIFFKVWVLLVLAICSIPSFARWVWIGLRSICKGLWTKMKGKKARRSGIANGSGNGN